MTRHGALSAETLAAPGDALKAFGYDVKVTPPSPCIHGMLRSPAGAEV
jgi:hypothetical protein